MSDWLAILPLLLPLALAVLAILLAQRPILQRRAVLGGFVLLILTSALLLLRVLEDGMIVTRLGDWPAPFAIVLAVDAAGAGLSLAASIVGLAIAAQAASESREAGIAGRVGMLALLSAMVAGVNGTLLTGDIFNLYVWFEITLITALGLMVLGGRRAQLDGALRYAALNMLATSLLLISVTLLYGRTGALNMAALVLHLQQGPADAPTQALALLALVALATKAGAAPLMFWLPAAYHTPSPTVTALMGGLLTKAAAAVMLRFFGPLFVPVSFPMLDEVLLALGALTTVVAAAGLLSDPDLRRIGSYAIMAGIGFALTATSIGGAEALAGASLYLGQSMIASAALFLMIGALLKAGGGVSRLQDLGGVAASHPGLAVIALILFATQAGLPPSAGFWPKLLAMKAAAQQGEGLALAVVLLNGFLVTLALARIYVAVFWRVAPNPALALALQQPLVLPGLQRWPLVALTALTIWIGLWPEPVIALARLAGQGLADPSGYARMVDPCRTDCIPTLSQEAPKP